MKQKLRIGVVINDQTVDSWMYEMLNIINLSDYAEISSVYIVAPPKRKSLWSKRKEFLFNIYTTIEDRLFKSPNRAFIPTKLESLAKDKLYNFKENETVVNPVDVLIDLNVMPLHHDLINSSKNGVWKYHHGDYKYTRGDCFGVWELFENRNEIGVTLMAKNYKDHQDVIINETLYATDNYLIGRTRNEYYWNAKSILPRKLEELYKLGSDTFFGKYISDSLPDFYYNKTYTTPTNWESIKYIPQMLWRVIKKFISRRYQIDQWIILFKLESKNQITTNFNEFIRILPPLDRFWADPFILKRNDKYYVFIEELLYSEDKGKLCVFEMDEEGNYTKPELILERPYHLSYPLIIEDNDNLYMLPETRQNKTIELYKCTDFPLKWELEKTLFSDIEALDSTIFKHNGKYWLFTNIEHYNGHEINRELHLFYTDELLSDNWTEHPQNPIVNNLNHSRPAGNIFIQNNRIYRPTQNCTKHYGYGLHIREITELTETNYAEQSAQEIFPNWDKDVISVHTLNSVDRLTFTDAMITRNKF